MNSLITVLMPAYNAERFIAEAIRSVLNQSHSNFELLIFNDGSTDRTAEIIDSFHDSRIKVHTTSENKGHIEHLNTGIGIAKGKYIARMDADDISLPSRFQKQFDFLEAHPEVGICGTQIEIIDENSNTLRQEFIQTQDEELRVRLLVNTCFSHPTVMIRKTILDEHTIRYKKETFPAEDYALWHILSVKTKLANLPDTLFRYRVHTQQITQTKQNLINTAVSNVRVSIIEHFLGRPITEQEVSLHGSLINSHYTIRKDFVISSRQWLQNMAAHNRATGYYETDLFENFLSQIWFSLCTNAYKLGYWIILEYLSSELKGNISQKERIKFFIKSIFKFSPYVSSNLNRPNQNRLMEYL